MIWLRRMVISVVVVILLGGGGYFLYGTAYTSGESSGYDTGYLEGHETGYLSGEADGYREGETDGYTSGIEDGYSEGESDGYISGKADGYNEGEAAGYVEGEAAGYESGYDEGMEDGLGHGYTLRDPAYQEVIAFLRQDKTDENEYDGSSYGVYVCSHYARDVCNSAEHAGFRCAFVEIRYMESGHAIVAFDTIDEGLVYFEPQNDWVVKPVIDKRYYQCVEPDEGYYYEEPDYDDTIKDILVTW